ncbi:phage tail tape measure protein [Microbacterium sp.]|uniref:phage tail tape measure protein n=1 Tax=Microbacterium sp. TaxID=51671 RepID=UPI0039E41A71
MALDLGELVAFLDLDTSKWDAAVERTPSKFSGKAAAFGAAGLVVGGVLAAAMTKGLTDAIDFEATNSKVAAQLGLTADESARVGTLAGKVYAQNYGESVEQVQQTIGGVVTQIKCMGDANDSTVESMTAKVLNYASAFEVETSEAIGMVQQLMSSGLATSADHAMDLMTTAMQKVPEALRGDMRDAITEYGPHLAALGMSGEEAFSLLASGADKGSIGIDKAGDALKEFSIRATDMSTSSVAAYDAIGLNAEDMAGKVLAGGDTAKGALDDIVKGLLAVEDPTQRANAAIALFGTPIEDLGVNGIPSFLSSLTSLGGGFEDVAGATDSLEVANDNVASQMEAMNRQIGEMFRGLMSTLLPALQAVFGFLAANPGVLQAVAIALGVLATAFIGVSVATWAMNTALLANPITWIVVGIMALVGALIWLVANWDEVVAWITEIWGGFMGWLGDVLDGFVAWWNVLWAGVGQWITGVWNGFIGWITDTWNGFVGWLMDIGNSISTWWNDLWTGIGNWVRDIWQQFVGWVTGIALGFVVWIMARFNEVRNWWNGLWSGIGAFFESIWKGVVAWATSTISGFIRGWQSTWNGLTSFFSSLWSGIENGVRKTWEGVLDFFEGIPDKVMSFFAGIGDWLVDSGKALIQGFLDGISAMIGSIGDTIGGVMDFIGGFFPNSPAERGQFSGAGWTRLRHSGAAIMDEFTKGMQGADPFGSTFDARLGDAVRSGSLGLDVRGTAGAAVATGNGTTIINNKTMQYHAAENRALSSEEELFAALGSPRSPFASAA